MVQVEKTDPLPDFQARILLAEYRGTEQVLSIGHVSNDLAEAADKDQAFKHYAAYYLSTDGQIYWSDTHQLSIYPENYHLEIDRRRHAKVSGV